jgi:hypothetical protein
MNTHVTPLVTSESVTIKENDLELGVYYGILSAGANRTRLAICPRHFFHSEFLGGHCAYPFQLT